MNGKTFLRMISGQAPQTSPAERERRIAVFKSAWPHADYKHDDWQITARCKVTDKGRLCMKCGHLLKDMSAFKLVRGEWVPRKTKPHPSTQVCDHCNPHAAQPILVYRELEMP